MGVLYRRDVATSGASRSESGPLALTVGITVIVAGLWIWLATRTPTSTFHLAPLITALAGPAVLRSSPVGTRSSLTVVSLIGTGVATLAGLYLWMTDSLVGPTFFSETGAPIETALMIAIGSAIGLLLARRQPTS